MASFSPAQQSFNQGQGHGNGSNSNNYGRANAAAIGAASSAVTATSSYLDPSFLSNTATPYDPRSPTINAPQTVGTYQFNNPSNIANLANLYNTSIPYATNPYGSSNPWNPPNPRRSPTSYNNASYMPQTLPQQAYLSDEFGPSYLQPDSAQQSYYSNRDPPNRPSPNHVPITPIGPPQPPVNQSPLPVMYPQNSSGNTVSSPQRLQDQNTQTRQPVARTAPFSSTMSNGNSSASQGQQPASCAMERRPRNITPVPETHRYSHEEVSPRSQPRTLPPQDSSQLMPVTQTHLVPQSQATSSPTTQFGNEISIPQISLSVPVLDQSTSFVANRPVAEVTNQFVDLTQYQSSNAPSQEQGEPETFRELWNSLEYPSGSPSPHAPVVYGEGQQHPVDSTDYLKKNPRAAQTVAGLLSQSSKTLDVPLKSKTVRDALNSALADPSMVVVSEYLTSVGTINAAPMNHRSWAPPTGICPRSVFSPTGPPMSFVAPDRSVIVRPGPCANTCPSQGGYPPLHSLPSPPHGAVNQQAPTAGPTYPPPLPPTAGPTPAPQLPTDLATPPPTPTTNLVFPPTPSPSISPGQTRSSPFPVPDNFSHLRSGMNSDGTSWTGSFDSHNSQASSSSVQTGSRPSFTTQATKNKKENLRIKAQKNAQSLKRKQREASRNLGPTQPPPQAAVAAAATGEEPLFLDMAPSHASEGEASKRARTVGATEPFPTYVDNSQALLSRPGQETFSNYQDNQQENLYPSAPMKHEQAPVPVPTHQINQHMQTPVPNHTNYQHVDYQQENYQQNYQQGYQRPPVSPPTQMVNQQTQTVAPTPMINQQTQVSRVRRDSLPTRVDEKMLAAIGPYAMLF